MAGYVFAIGDTDAPVPVIRECAEEGGYTIQIAGISPEPFDGALADRSSMKPGDRLKHEMELEAALAYNLSENRCPPLGEWDYVSVASPFEPVDHDETQTP